MAAEQERENAPSDTYTIKACADDTGELATDLKAVSFRTRARQETRTRWGWRVRVGASESRNLLLNFDACATAQTKLQPVVLSYPSGLKCP